jgi:hypothetical protein
VAWGWRRVALGVGATMLISSFVVTTATVRALATRSPYHVTLPDLEIAVPTGLIGIGPDPSTGDPDLQFTHITWDAGAGPFELKPKFNRRTGISTFSQVIFKSRGGASWRKDFSVRLARTGIFIASEGHYRFPLTRFTLNDVNSDGSLGALVATSLKTDYCIQGDTQVGGVPNTPNNDFISQSDCNKPSAALGWSVGWGDQYDQTDPGQPIDLTGLPTNQNYILHASVDPDNLFTDSNKSNNVTDTELHISNTDASPVIDDSSTVQVISQTGPYNPAGNMTVNIPAPGGTVEGTVELNATLHPPRSQTVKSVQYLLDGEPLGAPVTSAPFSYDWTVGSAAPGGHLVSAEATNSAGGVMTAPVRSVTVRDTVSSARSVTSDSAPTVGIVNPAPGQTMSGVVPVAADASDGVGIHSVQFEVDGHPLGGPTTAAPYAVSWHTASVGDGPHTITAVATNDGGAVVTSSPVRVTVQNPAPPMACFVLQREIAAHGAGTVTTPRFPIAFGDEHLVAFVSAGGGHAQHATLTGGSLRWHLVKRSDAASGDLEIWTAVVPRETPAVTVTSSLSQPSASQHLAVIALEGTDGVGAASASSGVSGSPGLQLTTTSDTSLVYAVVQGALADAHHVPYGWFSLPSGATGGHAASWVQFTNQATGSIGTVVRIADRGAHTPWNMIAVELVNDDS